MKDAERDFLQGSVSVLLLKLAEFSIEMINVLNKLMF